MAARTGRPASSTMSSSCTGEVMEQLSRRHPLQNPPGHALRRLRRSEEGAVLVEFALVLPMMLLVFAVIIEGSRLFYSYQTTISGVRDAARYLARVVPANICIAGGTVTAHTGKLTTIVTQSVSGSSMLPSGVTVTSVTPSFSCFPGTYRGGGNAAVAQVTATITVTFPFGAVFSLFSGTLPTLTTTVTDQSRIFGA